MGGIIGIDPSSWDRNVSVEREQDNVAGTVATTDDVKPGESTKIRIMKREEVEVVGNA